MAQPRDFADFRAGLKAAYEEEFSGEAFFDALGHRLGGRAAEVLALFVEIERATQRAVEPLAQRHGLPDTPREDLFAEGRAEAEALNGVTWDGFLHRVVAEYPVFIEEFESVLEMGDAADAPTLQVLVDHEVAMLEFARRELAGSPDALTPLHAFLDSLGATV